MLWPTHCVQNTAGAALAPGLERGRITQIIQKGTNPAIDSYSGFFDNGHRQATALHEYLQARGVADLYVMGLATDYCVKFTALDAAGLGYRVHLVPEGCRGVKLRPTDVAEALKEMQAAGVGIVSAESLLRAQG
jgi:nicotinamidase/pyrazinamidase